MNQVESARLQTDDPLFDACPLSSVSVEPEQTLEITLSGVNRQLNRRPKNNKPTRACL